MKTFRLLLVVSMASLTAGSVVAQTWVQTSAPTNGWNSIASSADGSKLVAAWHSIYTSADGGETWVLTSAPSGTWFSVASSADGSKLVAVQDAIEGTGGRIYTSTNAGATWTSNSVPYATWSSVASSADGNELVAANASLETIYISTNGGTVWMQATNAPAAGWVSVASSADGNKVVAVNHFPGRICTSANGGLSWIRATNAPSALPWINVDSSADGNKLVAVGSGGFVYSSMDSGNTWTTNNLPLTQSSSGAACASSDATKLVVVHQQRGIYSSIDSGTNWTSNNAPHLNWVAVASSADGNRLVASAWDGGIWTAQRTPSPQMNIAPGNGDLRLSWIVPSTNFLLQQNSDLTTANWADLTNKPALNLTNLQEEVILSPTNSSGFFRLKTP